MHRLAAASHGTLGITLICHRQLGISVETDVLNTQTMSMLMAINDVERSKVRSFCFKQCLPEMEAF